ncbi:MAG: hypothetical protein ACEPOZ_19950 [Marinifilaceae bacterium]
MKLIENLNELIENLHTLENYLKSDNPEEKEFAMDLVRKGKTILVYKVNGENHFAPSRFSGYKNNSLRKHEVNDEKDGRDTNPVITKIAGRPFATEKIEANFIDYCDNLGAEIPNNNRKYWRLKQDGKYLDLKI